jgi:phage baseplate assembly protein gpV
MELSNGTIIPHGLLSLNKAAQMAAFNKTYQNTSLRAGYITKSYAVTDKENLSKIATEYDVTVLEQDKSNGVTPIVYRRCISAEGLGAISDFLEFTLRAVEKQKNNKQRSFKDQNGAIVLILCLNGNSNSAVILGGLKHPDRKSKINSTKPQLFGSFNGVDIQILPDGSCRLTFNGATDNDGKPIDSSQGVTTLDIEKDGSFQVKNKGVTQRLQKDGIFSVTAEKSGSIDAKENVSLKAGANINTESSGNTSQKMAEWVVKASGSATIECASFKLQSQGDAMVKASQVNVEASSLVKLKGSQVILDGLTFCGGPGGTPAPTLSTKGIGVGNLGAPVMVTMIGPFATRTFIK